MSRRFQAAGVALALGILVTSCGGKSDSPPASGGAGGSDSGSGGSGPSGGTAGSGAGAAPSYDACADPSDCTYVPAACCSACTPQSSDFIALNKTSVDAYSAQRSCGDAICPHCASTTNAWFGTTCEAGHCKVFDARETDLTACESSSDCRLRVGVACCEPCTFGEFDVVALNANADLTSLVCGAETACDACAPIFPSTFTASCAAGRCQSTELVR